MRFTLSKAIPKKILKLLWVFFKRNWLPIILIGAYWFFFFFLALAKNIKFSNCRAYLFLFLLPISSGTIAVLLYRKLERLRLLILWPIVAIFAYLAFRWILKSWDEGPVVQAFLLIYIFKYLY